MRVRERFAPTGIRKTRIEGSPDPKNISTSYAERRNLNMRMQMRRFTRLTTGYSKKIENHIHMVALYTVWYNWIRTHKAHRLTPAMAAGLTDKLWSVEDIVALVDAAEARKARAVSETATTGGMTVRLSPTTASLR
jgi:hypothetical protein